MTGRHTHMYTHTGAYTITEKTCPHRVGVLSVLVCVPVIVHVTLSPSLPLSLSSSLILSLSLSLYVRSLDSLESVRCILANVAFGTEHRPSRSVARASLPPCLLPSSSPSRKFVGVSAGARAAEAACPRLRPRLRPPFLSSALRSSACFATLRAALYSLYYSRLKPAMLCYIGCSKVRRSAVVEQGDRL
jgi:hypothetical protein